MATTLDPEVSGLSPEWVGANIDEVRLDKLHRAQGSN